MESLLLVRNSPRREIILCPIESSAGAERHVVVLHSLKGSDAGTTAAGPHDAHCGIDYVPVSSVDISNFTKLKQNAIFGSLGLMRIGGEDYLCVLTAISHVGTIQGRRLFRIDSVDLVCISADETAGNTLGNAEKAAQSSHDVLGGGDGGSAYRFSFRGAAERVCAEIVALLSEGTFYFGYDWDATKCLQRTGTAAAPYSWGRCEMSFFWNHVLLSPVMSFVGGSLGDAQQAHFLRSGIFVIAFQGFAQVSEIRFAGSRAAFAVISRVSCKRAGMRFRSRGIDDDGHVSNFVETETLFAHPEYTVSYLIIRGTVPVFWEQQGFQLGYPRIQLTRTPAATQPAFDRHVASLKATYGLVHVLDLLGQKEGHAEYNLSSAFAYHVRKHPASGALSHTNFDIYAVCKNSSHERLDSLFHVIGRDLQAFGYYVADAGGAVLREQRGVFRVNCLDCLDRTNMTQSYIVRRTLDLFVRAYLLRSGVSYDAGAFQAALDALWAANGDQLSRIYTGSDAIKSSYGRLGRLTLSSFVADIKNNARRFYMNNFTEKARQEAIDVFLGRAESCEVLSLGSTRSLPEESGCAPGAASVSEEPLAERGLPSTSSRPELLCVMALTWNTGGVQPDALREYDVLVSAGKGTPVPHIFVASLQEIVELSASQIVNVDPEQRIRWEAALQDALQRQYGRQTQYSLIVSHQLVGTTISVFVQSSLLRGVRSVSIASKKTGMGGMAGNKGSVSIRFDFFDASLCFVSSHFTAGQGAAADRDRDAQSVLSDLAFPYGRSILSHDVVVWAGDMNYRIDLDREAAHARIVAREFSSLQASDQLAARLGVIGSPFWGFGEGALRFAPTYKYDPGTNIYDTSEKARVPSWTDRVLFRGGERLGVRPVYYDRAEIDVSDHKPVKCVLEVTRLPQ